MTRLFGVDVKRELAKDGEKEILKFVNKLIRGTRLKIRGETISGLEREWIYTSTVLSDYCVGDYKLIFRINSLNTIQMRDAKYNWLDLTNNRLLFFRELFTDCFEESEG